MKVEVVAIGTEVLSGFTVNTNAAFIARALFQIGVRTSNQTVLPDEESALLEGLKALLQKNDLVICTGGLGPTGDDVTRQVAAKLFNSDFHFNQELYDELVQRYGQEWPSFKDQSTVPSQAIIIRNHSGTAPGFIFETENKTLILLPGVPLEMQQMFKEQVLPYVKSRLSTIRIYTRGLHFFNLPESAVDPILREIQIQSPKIEYGIYPSQGVLSVYLSIQESSEKKADQILSPGLEKLTTSFSNHLFQSPSGKLEEAVQRELIERKLTLSAAESCTGGSFAARLTKLPGASQYFLGSVVAYSNALKTSLLNISDALIQEKGAVSQEVVEQMAFGIQQLTQSDLAVAVSGVAGPSGGTLEKPVGTIYCAVMKKGSQPSSWLLRAKGNREMIIERSVNALLSEILCRIK
jgi:nicotinamide-nucleotide amidase